MIDGLIGRFDFCTHSELIARIRVPIESWKIAAGNIETDSVPLLKEIAGRP